MNHDIALKICDTETSLYSADVLDLFNRVRSLQVIPLTVEGRDTNRMAMGFMTPEAAYELKTCNGCSESTFEEFIQNFIDNADHRAEDHTYHYGTLSIYLA